MIDPPKLEILLRILLSGHYNFSMHEHYQAIWEDFVHRYDLIKICSFDSFYDLFALVNRDNEDEFIVFIGALAHNYYSRNRIVRIVRIIDMQISEDEFTILRLTI